MLDSNNETAPAELEDAVLDAPALLKIQPIKLKAPVEEEDQYPIPVVPVSPQQLNNCNLEAEFETV
jgi:hypothetical protein